MKRGEPPAGADKGDRPDVASVPNVPSTDSFTGITLEGLIDPCVWYVPVHDGAGRIVDLRYVDANRAACDYNGASREELLGRTLMELFPAHGHTGMLQRYIDVVETGEPLLLDDVLYPLDTAGGEQRQFDIRAVRVADGLSLTWRDVTERLAEQRAIADSEARFRLLAEHATDVVYETDERGRFLWVSPSVQRVLGWLPEQLIGTRAWALVEPDDLARLEAQSACTTPDDPAEMMVEARFLTTRGDHRWMSLHSQPKRATDGTLLGMVVGLRDCQSEVVARRALRTLSAANAALVRAINEDELLHDMCEAATSDGGYQFAWYGRPEDDTTQTVTPLAHSQKHSDYLDHVRVSWGDNPLGQGPAGTVLRTGSTHIVHDLRSDTAFEPWRTQAHERGFRSVIGVPVVVDRRLDGALCVYAAEVEAFDVDAVQVLEELATQVGIGLARLRTMQQLTRSLAQQSLLMTAIDQAADSVIVTDATRAIVYANPGACETTGYSLEEMLGKNPRLFQSGLHDRSFYQAMWARLLGGQPFRGVLVNRRRTGEIYEDDTTITPVHDHDGTLVAYVAVKHDLTRQRNIERRLSREHGDRDVVLEIMRDVRPTESLEATASAFCQAVTRLDRIDAAIIMLLSTNGDFVPVGSAGYVGVDLPLGTPIPVEQAEGILAATNNGPWWVDLTDQTGLAGFFPDVSLPMVAAGFVVSAYAPIHWEGTPVGAIAVTTRSGDAPAWIDSRLRVLEELGGFAGMLFGARVQQFGDFAGVRTQIREILDLGLFHAVYQPVIDLRTGAVRGYEALTRFDDDVRPDTRIAAAHTVGLGSELEAACARAAIVGATALDPAIFLSINFSPATLIDGTAAEVLRTAARPIVVEVTEHLEIQSYPAARRAIRDCGGVQVAVDDAGAGFASLRHILELKPDYVKLDIALVRDIDTDPARQALAAGLRHFCARTGTTMIAEGVERAAEGAMLRELGVDLAQGYLYGYPERLP